MELTNVTIEHNGKRFIFTKHQEWCILWGAYNIQLNRLSATVVLIYNKLKPILDDKQLCIESATLDFDGVSIYVTVDNGELFFDTSSYTEFWEVANGFYNAIGESRPPVIEPEEQTTPGVFAISGNVVVFTDPSLEWVEWSHHYGRATSNLEGVRGTVISTPKSATDHYSIAIGADENWVIDVKGHQFEAIES